MLCITNEDLSFMPDLLVRHVFQALQCPFSRPQSKCCFSSFGKGGLRAYSEPPAPDNRA